MPTLNKSRSLTAAAALAFMVALPTAGPAQAQEGDPVLGERVWREFSYCGDCHGWAGDGIPNVAQRNGADLREVFTTPELAFETIRCGRPGTAMPAFRRNTWTEIIPCYGMITRLAPGMQPERAESQLSDRFIEALVAFIFREFIGAGPVTREYCVGVFGVDSRRCSAYPTAAELEVAAIPAPAAAAAVVDH